MNVPNAAVLVMTNDWLKSILNPTGEQVRLNEKQKNHEQNFTAFLISGLIAGSISGFVTCPLDVIKKCEELIPVGYAQGYMLNHPTDAILVNDAFNLSIWIPSCPAVLCEKRSR